MTNQSLYQIMRRRTANGELIYMPFDVGDYQQLLPKCAWLNELAEKYRLPARFFITEYDHCDAV